MAAEELVERVLAGDVDREPAAAAARAAPHLPQRRDRARERHDDRGVERADVDAELERVGRDDREQLAADQPRLELAPLLRRVAGAVGRDARRRARVVVARAGPATSFAISSTALRDLMKQIVRAPPRTSSTSMSAASAERASAACRAPRRSSGGFHIAICRARAAASRRGRRARCSSRPVSRSASSTGLAIVALRQEEARLVRGAQRCAAAAAARCATCEPNTPR